MGTFYLDYLNGNDGNDGSDWAHAWKTITGGPTAARVAPNDTIRIAKSPDPTSLGITAAWTDKSYVVTLTSALTQNIDDCDAAWSVSANVSYYGSSDRQQGTQSNQITIASAFTTGKVAYHATGLLDLSGYKQVSFWIKNNSAALSAGVMKLALCSDTIGDTIVNDIPIPAIASTYEWVPITVNYGAALGAAIQSVALYAISDPGAVVFYLDNIFACKDATSADSLCLNSLISKNSLAQGGTEAWYSILNILGTRIALADDVQSNYGESAYSMKGYSGTTETVTTYKRETIKTALATSYSTSVQEVQDSGSDGNKLTFSGGWDTVGGTRNGETFFDGQTSYGYGLVLNGKSYVEFLGVNFLRYYTAIYLTSAPNNTFTILDLHGSTGIYLVSSNTNTITITNVHNCSFYGIEDSGSSGNTYTVTNATSIHGSYYPIYFSTCISNIATITNIKNCSGTAFYITSDSKNCTATITTIDSCGRGVYINDSIKNTITVTTINNCPYGISIAYCAGNLIKVTDISNSSNYGIYFDSNSFDNIIVVSGDITVCGHGIYNNGGYYNKVVNAALSTNITDGVYLYTGILDLENCQIDDATDLAIDSSANYTNARIRSNRHNQTANNHKIKCDGGYITSETSVRHTASGISWKLSPTSTIRSATYPLNLPIARIVCNANNEVTVKAWFRRDNTGVTAKLACRAYQIGGVVTDVTASMTADADTWEELTITFTPTYTGVVEIEAWAYGGTSYNVYVDDMTISQA